MREINIGDKVVKVRATPLTLLYYKQAFGTDLVGDMIKMQVLEKEPSKIDSVVFLQMTWAMAKADNGPGKQFPGFENWVSELESFDMSDQTILQAVIEEAIDGFFRRAQREQKR